MIRVDRSRQPPEEPERTPEQQLPPARPRIGPSPEVRRRQPPATSAGPPPLVPLTVAQFIARMPVSAPQPRRLATPAYSGQARDDAPRVGLAVENMRRHMTDEGWRLFEGLEAAGYHLYGHDLPGNSLPGVSLPSCTDVREIVDRVRPSTVLMQDKREWEGFTANQVQNLSAMRFWASDSLSRRPDVFRLTVLKDSHARPAYHHEAAEEIGCHAWVVYYHPRIVSHVASYLRPQHMIRTHHCVDPASVPAYSASGRSGVLLSGAVSSAYPLRRRLAVERASIPGLTYLPHPGYHCNGCVTPQYLQLLSQFRVAICTASVYGYALRKLVEATAAGCVVLTDLPVDEVLPEIDGNLHRIHPDTPTSQVSCIVSALADNYSPERQAHYATAAVRWYSTEAVGRRLAADIEALRKTYPGRVTP